MPDQWRSGRSAQSASPTPLFPLEQSRAVAAGLEESETGSIPVNVPLHLTSFIGRDREVANLRDLLLRDDVRLLTLTGPPGTGKTRLSLRPADDFLRQAAINRDAAPPETRTQSAQPFATGVVFVPLATVVDSDLVGPAIAQALGLRNIGARPLLETVIDFLRRSSSC